MQLIQIVDTHTGGEPTRIVTECPVEFQATQLSQCRAEFSQRYDDLRRAIVCEPRGNDVMVGALLTPAENADSLAGVIFFNNVGTLGMCGHGTLGVIAALHHLGRMAPGTHRLDTPVGTVEFSLLEDGKVHLQNVPSYRYRAQVSVQLSSGMIVSGDIAWGGNWFFICEDHSISVAFANIEELKDLALEIRERLDSTGVTGRDEAVIDHVELIGPPTSAEAHAKNFVLCPGGAYDRSPCGTGTCAKLACLAADGKLPAGQVFRQESIVGSIFEASFEQLSDNQILPTLCGRAFVTGRGELLLDPRDPFCMGIPL